MDDENHTRRLCRAAQNGDRKAASELLVFFHKRIFGYFRRLCSAEADAEDLTQQVFCKVWASLPSFRGNASVATWIYRISYHVYVDWRRRPNRIEPQLEAWWDALPANGPSPFETAADAEMAARIYSIVGGLDEETRQAIHFHYYEGLTLKETAEVLDVPTSTLKYRLRNGLKTIRRMVSATTNPAWEGAKHD